MYTGDALNLLLLLLLLLLTMVEGREGLRMVVLWSEGGRVVCLENFCGWFVATVVIVSVVRGGGSGERDSR